MTDEQIEMLERILKLYNFILINHRDELFDSDSKFCDMVEALEQLIGKQLDTFPL